MPVLIQQLNFSAATAKLSSSSSRSSFQRCRVSFRGYIGETNGVARANKFLRFGRHSFRSKSSLVAATAATADSKWLLEPTGDGDCSHIGEKIPLPDAFELLTDSATVGRLPDKADIVIPVGTVSGLHARLEKKGSVLLVTDLDSTNGTYVNNKRVRPGSVTQVLPGSSIIFGDEHLAQFKFSIEEVEDEEESNESS